MNETPEKKKRKPGGGRKPSGKVSRHYKIDADVAEYVDGLPDGSKSQFVNDALREKIEKISK